MLHHLDEPDPIGLGCVECYFSQSRLHRLHIWFGRFSIANCMRDTSLPFCGLGSWDSHMVRQDRLLRNKVQWEKRMVYRKRGKWRL